MGSIIATIHNFASYFTHPNIIQSSSFQRLTIFFFPPRLRPAVPSSPPPRPRRPVPAPGPPRPAASATAQEALTGLKVSVCDDSCQHTILKGTRVDEPTHNGFKSLSFLEIFYFVSSSLLPLPSSVCFLHLFSF